MKWTKLKQRIESRFVPELNGRVEVYTTCYRRAHDDEGELFVTLDGEKIYGAAQYTYWNERAIKCANVQTEATDPKLREQEIEDLLTAEGVIPHWVLTKAAFDSLNQPIEDMLASVHPLIRGLAVLDTRCGRRRLAKIDADNEHPFVRRLLVLRQ